MPPPVPRCSGWASSSLISPDRISLSRYGGRVGLHIDLFGACSAFTRVAACTLAQSPIVTDSRRLQPFRYLHDCSDCFRLERIAGWGLHPLESAALSRRTPEADGRTIRGSIGAKCESVIRSSREFPESAALGNSDSSVFSRLKSTGLVKNSKPPSSRKKPLIAVGASIKLFHLRALPAAANAHRRSTHQGMGARPGTPGAANALGKGLLLHSQALKRRETHVHDAPLLSVHVDHRAAIDRDPRWRHLHRLGLVRGDTSGSRMARGGSPHARVVGRRPLDDCSDAPGRF